MYIFNIFDFFVNVYNIINKQTINYQVTRDDAFPNDPRQAIMNGF